MLILRPYLISGKLPLIRFLLPVSFLVKTLVQFSCSSPSQKSLRYLFDVVFHLSLFVGFTTTLVSVFFIASYPAKCLPPPCSLSVSLLPCYMIHRNRLCHMSHRLLPMKCLFFHFCWLNIWLVVDCMIHHCIVWQVSHHLSVASVVFRLLAIQVSHIHISGRVIPLSLITQATASE